METVWQQIAASRIDLAHYLEQLSALDWQAVSPRTKWTVQELTAHIILQTKYRPLFIARYIVQARFDTNRFMDVAAKNYAAQYEPRKLIQKLQAIANNHHKPPKITASEVLIDLWIHTIDICMATSNQTALTVGQRRFVLDFISRHPKSHGLRIMGIDAYLRRYTYHISDFEDISIGVGPIKKNITSDVLFYELIG